MRSATGATCAGGEDAQPTRRLKTSNKTPPLTTTRQGMSTIVERDIASFLSETSRLPQHPKGPEGKRQTASTTHSGHPAPKEQAHAPQTATKTIIIHRRTSYPTGRNAKGNNLFARRQQVPGERYSCLDYIGWSGPISLLRQSRDTKGFNPTSYSTRNNGWYFKRVKSKSACESKGANTNIGRKSGSIEARLVSGDANQ